MDGLIDPSADAIWDSVSTISTSAGVEHKFPRTEDEWKALEHHAIVLVEAGNLLVIPGRRIAEPGQKADLPNIELSPEEIEQAIAKDRQSWTTHARHLQDSADDVLRAIRQRSVDRLFDSGAALDTACETCHKKYWYPDKTTNGAASTPRQPS